MAVEDDGRARIALDAGRGAVLLPLEMIAARGVAQVRAPVAALDRTAWTCLEAGVSRSDGAFPILPDIRPVHERSAAIFQRHALEGMITQLTRGEGSDFDALTEFRPGMDRRTIDWKQSARHMKLLAKKLSHRAQQPDRLRHR